MKSDNSLTHSSIAMSANWRGRSLLASPAQRRFPGTLRSIQDASAKEI